MKKIAIIIGVFIIIMPIALICATSYMEMKKYEPKAEYRISEKCYGDPTPVERVTMEEKVPLNGKFVSHSFAFADAKNSGAEEGWFCDPGYAKLMNASLEAKDERSAHKAQLDKKEL